MNHYFTYSDVKSELKKTTCIVNDKKFIFNTDNGVFSKRGLDFGSRTLIDVLLSLEISGNLLDVGCGYGVIGIILSSFFDVNVDMVDVNKRAIHLTNMNIKANNVSNVSAFYSDIYSNVDKKYDVIVTNPPIRAGKDTVYKFLFDAKNYLACGGSLYFVINKDQGAKSVIKDLSSCANVEVLRKNKGFFVIKCIFD